MSEAKVEMAEAEDVDIRNCPVCFEPYEESGGHVPRILPCYHTLCEVCVGGLLAQGNQQQVICQNAGQNIQLVTSLHHFLKTSMWSRTLRQ